MSALLIGLMLMTAKPPAIEVQGHRGARASRPENTLPAFEYALSVGADVLELDLVVTADDRLVVFHDPFINPELCLGPKGAPIKTPPPIRSLSLAEVQAYDCGTLPNPRFPKQERAPGARIPALEQVFELVKNTKHAAGKKVRFNIETKSVPALPDLAPPPEKFASLVVTAVKNAGFLDRTVVQSFDHRTLIAAKKLEPRLEIAALISDNFVDHVAVAKSIGAKIVSPDKLWITKDAVKALHDAGIRVIPWTANSTDEWRALIELGVDGIITDDPAGLIEFLRQNKLR